MRGVGVARDRVAKTPAGQLTAGAGRLAKPGERTVERRSAREAQTVVSRRIGDPHGMRASQ